MGFDDTGASWDPGSVHLSRDPNPHHIRLVRRHHPKETRNLGVERRLLRKFWQGLVSSPLNVSRQFSELKLARPVGGR
jgi:hypothetical protein